MGTLAATPNARTRSRLTIPPASGGDPLVGAQFSDDFNRSDRTLNGDNGWVGVASAGSLTIGTNKASFNSTTNGSWGTNAGSPTPNANHWAAFQVISSSGHIVGAVARYADTANFYVARLDRSGSATWQLYKRVSNSYTLLNSLVEAAPAEPYYMRIYCVGTSIKGQLWNGSTWVDKVSATDSAHATGTPGFFGQVITSGSIQCDNYGSGTAT